MHFLSSRSDDPFLLQENDQGSRGNKLASNVDETQPTSNLHRQAHKETVKHRDKAQEVELRFLRSEVKVLKKSANRLCTIGPVLENIQRRLNDVESGDRRNDKAETDREVSQEIPNSHHSDGSDEYVMRNHAPMLRRIKKT